jgi:hypothetical protein
MKKNMMSSIVAVGAGFFVTALLSIGTDALLHALGVFPPWGQPMSDTLFVLATMYRVVFTVAGGYLTARLAPERPMRHVIVLGCIGVVAATLGVALTWNSGPELGPKWYPVLLVVTALPCVWLGGRMYGSRGGRLNRQSVAVQ